MLATLGDGIYSTTEVKSVSNTAINEVITTKPIIQLSEVLSDIETKIQAIETMYNIEPSTETSTTGPPILIQEEKIQNLLVRVKQIKDTLDSL